MHSLNKDTNSQPGTITVLAATLAFCLVFAAPLLSGSNHKCPVLRERDSRNPSTAEAVPAFARKYNVDCTYCHTAWPQLNRTGLQFRYLGYRMPYEVPVHEAGKAPANTQAQPPVTPPSKPGPAAPSTPPGLPPSARIAEGYKVFNSMQCFTCHVDGGNIINPDKPLKGAAFLKKYPDDAKIAAIVRNGIPGTAMPAYNSDRLSDEQMTNLIAYIRSLTPPAP